MQKKLDPLTYENAKNAANYNKHTDEEEVIDSCKKRKLTYNDNPFIIASSQLKKKDENFRKYLSNFIIGSGLPFSIVENKQFIDLLKYISNGSVNTLPSRRTIVKNINEMHIYHMDQLKQKIGGKFVSLTTDEWSRHEFRVAVITLSYINEDDEVGNKIYSVYEVSTSTKHRDLADDLVSSLSKINLPINKITAITTDGASNMRSLCKQLECSNIHCLSHILNLILKTSVEKQEVLNELISRIRNSVIKYKRPKKVRVLKLKRKLKMDFRNENDFKQFTTTKYILIKAILEILQPFEKYTLISNTSNILQYISILFKVRDEIKSINTNSDNLLSNNENNNIYYNVDVSEDEEESEDFSSDVEDSSENGGSYFNNDYDDVSDDYEQETVEEIDEIKDITLSSITTIYELLKKVFWKKSI